MLMNTLLIMLFLSALATIQQAKAQTTIPAVNQQVVDYCTQHMNKKVDRGECWDLARFALDYAKAKWSTPYNFGEKVNYKNVTIYPGDIIQFEKVKLTFKNGYQEYPHHTAIVYQVLGENKFLIAHQNFAGKKKVHTWELDLNYLSKGKIQFYRPVQ